jgi:hypothetical protein
MKIGIATAFNGMLDFYSLTSVVKSQIRMIHEAGHTPVFIAHEDFSWKEKPDWLEVRPAVPQLNKIDYNTLNDLSEEHKRFVDICAHRLTNVTLDLDAVLTHDLIFTGWNVPVGLAVKKVSETSKIPWFHWIHSVPGGSRDYWTLPENSYLVYPNHTDKVRVAENFRTWPEKIIIIPHCCDLRDFSMTSEVAKKLVTDYDVFASDLVQVYPIPTDRAEAKGVGEVIRLFAEFKNLGHSVKIIIPNAWCNVEKWHRKVDNYMMLAVQLGLSPNEVIFTSRAIPEMAAGLPMSDIKDLVMCGNIFICPTQSETFGLSLAEAAVSGCLLVLNEDLEMMKEIVGGAGNALWAKFSSSFNKTSHTDEKRYYSDIAKIILHNIENSPSFKSTRYYRQNYRQEAVWKKLEGAILDSKRA